MVKECIFSVTEEWNHIQRTNHTNQLNAHEETNRETLMAPKAKTSHNEQNCRNLSSFWWLEHPLAHHLHTIYCRRLMGHFNWYFQMILHAESRRVSKNNFIEYNCDLWTLTLSAEPWVWHHQKEWKFDHCGCWFITKLNQFTNQHHCFCDHCLNVCQLADTWFEHDFHSSQNSLLLGFWGSFGALLCWDFFDNFSWFGYWSVLFFLGKVVAI